MKRKVFTVKRLSALFLSAVLTLSILSGCGSPQSETAMADTTDQSTTVEERTVKSVLDGVVSDSGFIGVATVYYNGENIWTSETGLADEENNTQNSTELIYRIGSMTKQFTAAGICILYDEDKLDLNDTVGKYFSGSSYGDKVTIKNMLNMTSGIPEFICDIDDNGTYPEATLEFEVSADASAAENRAAIEEWILAQELTFEPQEKFKYCNSNYFLLAEIIEKVSGESYENFLKEKIFDPLGMTSTSFDDSALSTKGYGYVEGSNKLKTEEKCLSYYDMQWTLYPGVGLGGSGLNSSADDLYKWASGLLNGKVLKPETLALMTEENDLGYGFGLFTNGYVCSHTGAWGSYEAAIVFTLDKKYISVVLTNYANSARDLYGGVDILLYNTLSENQDLLN